MSDDASDSVDSTDPIAQVAPDVPVALRTRITELLGVRLPIIQTGMGWVSGAHLTAATSAAGGFGILAAVTMTFHEMVEAIGRVRDATDAPFGVNFRPDQPDLDDRIAEVTKAGVKLVSFAGAPTKDTVARLHDAGVLVMPTVGARRHAQKMLGFGVDAVIAQGGEGGGHTGVVPTSLLLPQVVEEVGAEIPVLGAGG
ncbi:MAG: nitronate monooxygenase, partial [Dehalococcoidia bacterium]|nr:nitronate monooxygenase [Dehalococcoidia bacterium]